MALWSGRFGGEPDKDVFEYGRSLSVDARLIEDNLTGSQAWADALAHAGAISKDDASAIRQGLESIRDHVRANPAAFDVADDEDVHAFVERELIARIGDAGRRLHTGRSRNEQVSVDFRLYLRRRIPAVQRALVVLIEALLAQAEQAGDAVMPSYTHLRRAQPVLVAHVWLAHVAAFRRDVERLDTARHEADVMPLGSGAIAGTSYDVDVQALAAALGFSRVTANSLDTSGDRDFVAAFLFAATMAMVHVSRLAEDVILWTGEEFGFFELDDAVATGSSLMPQKKNPDPLELVRGKAGTVLGRLTGWLATMKSLPSGYNGSAGRQSGGLRRRGHRDALRRDHGDRRPHARAARGPDACGRVGAAAGDRGRGLSRFPRRAVPHRARNHRPHRPRAVRERARLLDADPRGMATLRREFRGGCPEGRHARGRRGHQAHAAVDRAGGGGEGPG